MTHSTQTRKKPIAPIFIAAVILALSAGCASLPFAKSILNGDVAEKRRQREQEIVRNFESHRDQAAYEAALARWEQNDPKGCREGLDALLARNPGHVDARLLLAEVDLFDKRPQDALKQVDEALRLQSGNARALYTKGLVLDAIGHSSDAVVYYEQAARAEPENEMYALCCKNIKDSDASQEPGNAVITTACQGSSNSDKRDSVINQRSGAVFKLLCCQADRGGNSGRDAGR